MATGYSPKIATDGLVFYYDTGNSKSYKGEPTTNLITDTAAFDSSFWNQKSGTITANSVIGPRGVQNAAKIVATNTDPYIYSSAIVTASTGNNTWSIWVKGVGNTVGKSAQVRINFSGTATGTADTNASVNLTDDWQLLQTTANVTSGGTIKFGLEAPNGAVSGDIMYFADPMFEQKSHATQFTVGARSVSGSLLDLTRRKTIDLSNVSFDSDAMLDFDGTSDYIAFSDNIYDVADEGTISELTISAWVKWDEFCSSGTYDEIISWWQGGTNTYADGFLGTSVYSVIGDSAANPGIRFGDGWTNTGYNFTSATDVDKWWNITAVKTADNAYIYINGVLEATKGSALSWGFNGVATIGRHSSGGSEYLNGKIGNIQLHSRALTPAEIQQNYNALKGRFGI
jgi:hypothetical protein